SKALRERWLLEGAPSSTAEEGEATKKLFEEDNLKAKELEENIQRLEKELEQLENGISASSTKENMAEETTRVVVKEEKLPHTPKVRTSFFLSTWSPYRVVVRMEQKTLPAMSTWAP
ncbi:hypothetical protein Chor_017146, partial [Crotalus horridus]